MALKLYVEQFIFSQDHYYFSLIHLGFKAKSNSIEDNN